MFDELTYFRVGLPDEAVARLMELSEESHVDPRALLAALLIDVLVVEFEEHHVPPDCANGQPVH